jgi:hypothetical protein
MRKNVWVWLLALAVTLASAVWQRLTGPTYPVRGHVRLGEQEFALTLERSHSVSADQELRLAMPDRAVSGEVAWRRYPTKENWHVIPLGRAGDMLIGSLPRQPMAGRLEYQVRLMRGPEQVTFPSRPAITRFKGDVPEYVLGPHILLMFLGMLFATKSGLDAVLGRTDLARLAWITLGLLFVGGFLLGPAVQKYAFDAWWTGVPFGWDLTDNKTLLAVLVWLVAAVCTRSRRLARAGVIAAAVVTLVVFAIPHSVWGSQINWSQQAPASAPR